MPSPILASVPLVRVMWVRTQNNVAPATDTATATPTVPYLTVPGPDGGHGFIDPLRPVVSQLDENDVAYVDLVATDDDEVVEAFGWTFTFQGSTRPPRTVSVPQSGGPVFTITVGGVSMPAVWLDDLADFSGASGPTGNSYAPFSYVDDSIEALQNAADPFPQYRLDTDPSGTGLSEVATKTQAYTAAAGQLVPADTTGGTFAVTFPTASPGAQVAVRWEAGTAAPTVAAGVPIGTGSATTASPFTMVGELLVWQVPAAGGRWRLVGKVLPQAGLDARFAQKYVGATTAANTRRLMMKLRRGVADASVLVIGDSTGNATDEWVYLWAQNVASRFPAYTVRIAFWDETGGTSYQAPSTIQTGTGSRTLTVWNCSAAGRAPGYVLGSRWDTAIVPTEPDLAFVNHGHNLGDPASSVNLYAQARANYLQLTEELAALFPFCGIVLIAQNPSLIAGRETWQARKADVLEEIAMLRGYGFIDVHQAFLDRSDMATLYGDTTHPNAAGSQLWASAVIAATAADAGVGLAAVGTPPLLAQARNFLGAGYDFSDWPSTTPTGWAGTNATLAKETTIRETGAQACRITPTADGAAQIEYAITPSTLGIQGLVSGQLLCFAVRLRAPSAHLATARVQLADNTGTGNAVAADLPVDTRDRFSWLFVVKRITTNPTYIGCRVIARTTGTAAADLIVDRAHLLLGAIPRCG